MTREHRRIVESWHGVIVYAMQTGRDEAAYRIARGLVQRLRELGYAL